MIINRERLRDIKEAIEESLFLTVFFVSLGVIFGILAAVSLILLAFAIHWTLGALSVIFGISALMGLLAHLMQV